MKRIYAAIMAILIGLGTTAACTEQTTVTAAQQGLEAKVIRMHIIANSDSQKDQELKLQVRDEVLNWGRVRLKSYTSRISRKTLETALRANLSDVEKIAQYKVYEEGYEYPVKVKLETTHFPKKIYGDVTFPEGEYLALRIIIGNGQGRNWWCSLYPSLCFIDATRPVMGKAGKDELKAVLTDEEQELVTMKTDFHFDFYLKRYLGGK